MNLDMNIRQNARSQIQDWLIYAVMLSPTLILALAVVWFAFALKRGSPIGLDDPAFYPRLLLLAPLCIPLLLGIGAAGVAIRLHAPKWATILLAAGVVSVPYVILFVQSQIAIARCANTTPEMMCGENVIYAYCVACAMNLANIVSITLLIASRRSGVKASQSKAPSG
jgi:hypothetical protein